MEKFSGEMKRAELQKGALFKTYEQVQSQASSVLLFTLQWKDLEERFDGIRSSLDRRAEELRESEKSLAERARDVASREEGLRSARQRVEEREEEVRRKEVELRSVETRLEECGDEERKEESDMALKRDTCSECDSLIRDKETELRSLMQATEECRRDYESKKEEVEYLRQELDSKEKKVRVVQSLLEENVRDLDVKVEELGSVKRSLDECSRAVQMKREELSVVHSQLNHSLEAREESEKRLSVLEHTIKERNEEVAMKAGELQSLKDKIKDCQVQLKLKEEEFWGICKSIEEHSKDLESKECHLHSFDILIEEHKEELKSKRKEFEEINSMINERFTELALKDRELESIETSIAMHSKELKFKEGELENMMKRVKQCQEETESKEENLVLVQENLEEVAKALELKSEEFSAIHASIKDRNLELASRKRQLESIQIDIAQRAEQLRLKEQEFAFIETSTLECTKVLESKMKQCDLMQKSVTECCQEFESKTRQLDSIQKRRKECFVDLELKEKQLYKLDVSIGECSRILEMKKKECNEQCMELELWRQWLDSIEKHSREMELRERTSVHSGVMLQSWKCPYGPALASCLNSQSTIAFDGKKMQMFIYQHFRELNRVCHKVLEIIQTSANAATLVLDAMEGFYPQDSGNKDGILDIGVIRRSCIFLLENLIRSSAEIKPQQREAAMKLAVEWKGKLKFLPSPEHPLEVLGFLKLLEAYKLASAFSANEIHDLVNSVSQFQIAQELQVLGCSAVPPGSFGSIQHWPKKTEGPENFAVHNADDSSVVNPPLPTVSARKDLQHFHTELMNEIAMICEQISHKLQNSSDPAKLVLDVFAGTQCSNSKDMNLEADVLRSQIILLEQLVRIPPLITDEVKEGAMMLAREWKAKLSDKTESGLEVLAFQHFLAAYNLVSLLNESEIQKLAEIVSLNNDAPLLDQTLGLVNEITAHQLAYLLLSPESISNRSD